MNLVWRCVLACLITAICVRSSSAFTLLGYRSIEDIALGSYHAWNETAPGVPFELSYAIDGAFLSNQAGVTSQEARQAAHAAFHSWYEGTHGHVGFAPAPWDAVPNDGPAPPFAWEGPAFEEWLEDRDRPVEDQRWPGALAGWGANVDIFSRPQGFTMTSGSLRFEMHSTTLGFAVVNRSGSELLSAEIYLNDSFNWSVDGGPGFDIQTVLVHELGHCLGLDHPSEAVANGAPNLDPVTFQPGDQWSPSDVMFHNYTGVKRSLTADEIGGIRFLYQQIDDSLLLGDLNGDGQVTAVDLGVLLGLWGTDNPVADLNGDGIVNAADLAILVSLWNEDVDIDGILEDHDVDDPRSPTSTSAEGRARCASD